MSKRLLILDNYDSFTYNLVQQVREKGQVEVTVIRNDETTVDELKEFDAFIFSPGPGLPKDSGILCDLISTYSATHPMMGVCLGMQAIAEVAGGRLYNMESPLHGIATEIEIDPDEMFAGIDSRTTVGRYHSWAVDPASLNGEWVITARDAEGVPMAIRHQDRPIFGVQFHPESILTDRGGRMISNFLNRL